MVYCKLILFCIRQLSLISLWQSGAELDGSEVLRQRTLRHRKLKNDAGRMLVDMAREDLGRVIRSYRPGSSA